MFESILVDCFGHFTMHIYLSAEKLCVNVESEPRTYCCGREGTEQIFESGVAKKLGGWGSIFFVIGVTNTFV